MKNIVFAFGLALVSSFEVFSQVYPDDIASQGLNSWILHTPDDGTRNYLHLAPGTNSSSWQWSKGTLFYNSGFVKFQNDVEIQSTLKIKNGNSNGTPHSFSKLTLEHNDNTMISLLTPNSKVAYFGFADNDDNYVGGMQYEHSFDRLIFRVNNHINDLCKWQCGY